MPYDEPQFYRLGDLAERVDRDVVDMVSGNPDWGPPPAVAEGLRTYADSGEADPAAFQYPPSEGLDDLRAEIAARRDVPESSVLVTSGAAEANHLALAAAIDRWRDGRSAGGSATPEVILTDPVYPYYPAKVELLGARVRRVPTGPSGDLDPDAVRAAAGPETAAVLLNTPNNPTGAVYDAATIREVTEVAADAGAVLVSDETYDHVVLDGPFASALAVDAPHRVVTASASKTFAVTGFRVGWGFFPPDLAERARTRHLLSTVSASRPAQAAVLHALRETDPTHHEAVRERLRDRVETFATGLEAAGATVRRPAGGFYVLASLPDLPGTMDNAERLIREAGVAAMPGETFGDLGAWFRFALVTPAVETAVERLTGFLESA
ncbi:MAG: pyridoxal phosphate-dependent aminotransferase [Halobacteriaceae archaeon]